MEEYEKTDSRFDKNWFISKINHIVSGSSGNLMGLDSDTERMFHDPVIGFLRGDDPIFETFKTVINQDHYMPSEIIEMQAQKRGLSAPGPAELSVVSYILPIITETKRDNAAEIEWLSRRWAKTRLSGEQFNSAVSAEIVDILMSNGILAVAPDNTPGFKRIRSEKTGLGSNWSHRHIAYSAGLGTFGVHNLLITGMGAAHRCGSIVVTLKLEPELSRNENIYGNCLHRMGIKCLKCADRCPVGAIDETGHNKDICSSRVDDSAQYCKDLYNLDIYGCGLCSTGVPCESGVPEELK